MVERDALIASIKEALDEWNKWRAGKSLLTEWPPAPSVYAPIKDVLEKLPAYRAIKGLSLFSGYSGVVISSDRMALEALRHAARQKDDKAILAADWLLEVLTRREGPGFYYTSVWGLHVDAPGEIAPGISIIPFNGLPDSDMKRRIETRAKRQWNDSAWQSQSYFDLPGAVIVQSLNPICYIGAPEIPFAQIDDAQSQTRSQLALLQASVVGAPLTACSWFEWEDYTLDFNSIENWMHWQVPEVVPQVRKHITVTHTQIAGIVGKFNAIQYSWQKILSRSINRFVLSSADTASQIERWT